MSEIPENIKLFPHVFFSASGKLQHTYLLIFLSRCLDQETAN